MNESDKSADREAIIIALVVFITPVLLYVIATVWKCYE